MNINNIINTQTNFINQEIRDDVVYNNQTVTITGDAITMTDNVFNPETNLTITQKLTNHNLSFAKEVNNGSINNTTADYRHNGLDLTTWYPDTGDFPVMSNAITLSQTIIQAMDFNTEGVVKSYSRMMGLANDASTDSYSHYDADSARFWDDSGLRCMVGKTGLWGSYTLPIDINPHAGLTLCGTVSTEGQVMMADAAGNPYWATIGGGGWVGTATSDLDMDTYAINGLITTDVPRSFHLDGNGIQFYNNDSTDNITIDSQQFNINRNDPSTGQTTSFSRFQANDTACVNYEDPLNSTQCVISSFGIVNSKVVNGEFFPDTSHYSKDDMHLSDGIETLDVTGALLTYANGVDSEHDISATGLIVTDTVHASSIEIKGLSESPETGLQTSLSPYTLNFSDGDGIKTRYRKDGIQTYNGGTFDISTVAGLTLQNASGTAGQVIVSDASSNPSWGTATSTFVATADAPLDMATFQINNSGDITCSAISPVLIYDDTTVEGSNGQILASTGTGIRWIDNDIPDPIVSTLQYFIEPTAPSFQYPPVPPTVGLIASYQYYGWYFINAVALRKIDWFYAPNYNMVVSDILGLYMNYFNVTTTSNDNLPFISIYTKPTGVNDAIPTFAHSVMTYIPIFNPLAATPYCSFMNISGEQSEPLAYGHSVQSMAQSTVNNPRGEYLPTEQVLAICVGTSSTSTVNQVNFIMSKVGVCIAQGNQENILFPFNIASGGWVGTATSSLDMNAYNITSSSALSIGNTGVNTNLIGNVNIPATLRYNTTQLIFGGTAITTLPNLSASASVDWTGVNLDYVYWVQAVSTSNWTLTFPITNLVVGQRITVRNESRSNTFLVSATPTGLIYKTAIVPISTSTMSLYFVNTFQCVDNSINPRWICLSAT